MKKVPAKVLEVRKNVPELREDVIHLSYSHLSTFMTCPKQWYMQYVEKIAPYQPSIHTVFGTATHETIQEWVRVLYEEAVKKGEEMNLSELLQENMLRVFRDQREQNGNKNFSSPKELQEFYQDGLAILEFLKKHRKQYFNSKGVYLAGIETLLYQEIAKNVYFKGYIDLVLYDEDLDKWTLLDLKTSTSGWNQYAKSDFKKIAQLLLYKEFFAKQFNIDVDKIEVVYLILKRKINEDAEYASMKKRIQEFSPPSGKIKRGQVLKEVQDFLEKAISSEGTYLIKEHTPMPDKFTCKFCSFAETGQCDASFYKK